MGNFITFQDLLAAVKSEQTLSPADEKELAKDYFSIPEKIRGMAIQDKYDKFSKSYVGDYDTLQKEWESYRDAEDKYARDAHGLFSKEPQIEKSNIGQKLAMQAGEGTFFGLGDVAAGASSAIGGAGGAAYGALRGGDSNYSLSKLKSDYLRGAKQANLAQEEFQEESPVLAYGTEIAAGFNPLSMATKYLKGAKGLSGLVTGAAEGAAYGAGEGIGRVSTGEQTPWDALKNMAITTAGGGALGGVADAIPSAVKYMKNNRGGNININRPQAAMPTARPTAEELIKKQVEIPISLRREEPVVGNSSNLSNLTENQMMVPTAKRQGALPISERPVIEEPISYTQNASNVHTQPKSSYQLANENERMGRYSTARPDDINIGNRTSGYEPQINNYDRDLRSSSVHRQPEITSEIKRLHDRQSNYGGTPARLLHRGTGFNPQATPPIINSPIKNPSPVGDVGNATLDITEGLNKRLAEESTKAKTAMEKIASSAIPEPKASIKSKLLKKAKKAKNDFAEETPYEMRERLGIETKLKEKEMEGLPTFPSSSELEKVTKSKSIKGEMTKLKTIEATEKILDKIDAGKNLTKKELDLLKTQIAKNDIGYKPGNKTSMSKKLRNKVSKKKEIKVSSEEELLEIALAKQELGEALTQKEVNAILNSKGLSEEAEYMQYKQERSPRNRYSTIEDESNLY